MSFNYTLTGDSPSVQGKEDVLCYSDLGGHVFQSQSSQDIGLTVTEPGQCLQLIDFDLDPVMCKTFRVQITIAVAGDAFVISDIQFGDDGVCSQPSVPLATLGCDFQSGDCGIRNDGCGLVDWEIRDQSTSRRRRFTGCDQSNSGIPLLKKQIKSSCFYDLHIASLQPSGFSLISYSTDASLSPVIRRRRQSSGYSLYLDPAAVGGVAVGVLDLPNLQHGIDNAYLSFYHDMFETGLHDLMVTAVCTSDPGNSLIPLDLYALHYHKENLSGAGSGGTICLDIHGYVLEEECSTFAIQLQGAAVGTLLTVDDFYFGSSLSTLGCSKYVPLVLTIAC